MKQYAIIAGFGLLILTGCQQGDERLSEVRKVEEEAAIQAENANLRRRASEMEEDLANRHEFYQSTKGVYEGEVQTDDGEFRIRVTLAPSLPPVHSRRTRTQAEVEFDLTNLNFNVQIIQWKGGLPSSAVGCRVQGIRPDITAREMTIASQDCPNLYRIALGDQSLEGYVQPTTNANVYPFEAVLMDDETRKKL